MNLSLPQSALQHPSQPTTQHLAHAKVIHVQIKSIAGQNRTSGKRKSLIVVHREYNARYLISYCHYSVVNSGPGEYYCNEKSIWTQSCGIPTEPPTSAAPTMTSLPTMSPSTSSKPSNPSPTANPTKLSDVYYYMNTNPPTGHDDPKPSLATAVGEFGVKTYSPTYGNVDDRYFAPDDPLGSFFCGQDWSQAIEECPHRCPSGEAEQCPKGWSCELALFLFHTFLHITVQDS